MKKTFEILKNVFVWVVVAITVFVMIFTVVSVTTFDRNDRDLLGFRAYIVKSDSMSATDFDAGALIIVKETDPATLQEGDIIAYVSQNSESYGDTITHKIRTRTTTADGEPGFVTYGTTTNTDDETIVTYPYIMGKYKFQIPYMGTFFNFLKTPQGYIVCIFIPFMLLIIYQALNVVKLFRKYKQEQLAEVAEEKARLEAERAENARMMAEILELKAQLAAGNTVQTAQTTEEKE